MILIGYSTVVPLGAHLRSEGQPLVELDCQIAITQHNIRQCISKVYPLYFKLRSVELPTLFFDVPSRSGFVSVIKFGPLRNLWVHIIITYRAKGSLSGAGLSLVAVAYKGLSVIFHDQSVPRLAGMAGRGFCIIITN